MSLKGTGRKQSEEEEAGFGFGDSEGYKDVTCAQLPIPLGAQEAMRPSQRDSDSLKEKEGCSKPLPCGRILCQGLRTHSFF